MHLGPDTLVARSPKQLSSSLDDEIVVLEIEVGTYFSISGAGVLVWKLIERPTAVAQLQTAIMEAYEVDADRSLRDLSAFVDALIRAGLATIIGVGGEDLASGDAT